MPYFINKFFLMNSNMKIAKKIGLQQKAFIYYHSCNFRFPQVFY